MRGMTIWEMEKRGMIPLLLKPKTDMKQTVTLQTKLRIKMCQRDDNSTKELKTTPGHKWLFNKASKPAPGGGF